MAIQGTSDSLASETPLCDSVSSSIVACIVVIPGSAAERTPESVLVCRETDSGFAPSRRSGMTRPLSLLK
jgi:hypothetical protein